MGSSKHKNQVAHAQKNDVKIASRGMKTTGTSAFSESFLLVAIFGIGDDAED